MTQRTPPPQSLATAPRVPAASLTEQIRRGRMLFIAMAIAYALGNFNDNFMKQAVSLLAVSHGRSELQGWVGALFTIPFLLFTAAAGWLADRFSRRRVIILSKFLELLFLGLGAIGIVTLNWWLMIAVIVLMAIQATIFGPALTGSIPDVYPESFVVHANSRLKAATTGAILLGLIAAGLSLNCKGSWAGLPLGRLIVAGALVIVSTLGLIVSFGVPRRPAGNPQAPFPWAGPLDSLRDLWALRADGLLLTSILADSWFWFIAALQALFLNKMGILQFHLDYATTTYLSLAELLGVVAGALAAGKIIARDNGLWITPAATAGLAVFLCLGGVAPVLGPSTRLFYILAMLVGAGGMGGMMMVPLESFVQTRPAPERRGRVIAASWFAGFTGILLGSLAYLFLERLLQPTAVFVLMGILTFPVAALMAPIFARRRPGKAAWPAKLLCFIARIILRLRYRVELTGVEAVKQRGRGGILFLPNHPALIDPVIVTSWLHSAFGVRPLALENQIDKPIVRSLTKLIGVLPIPDLTKIDQAGAQKAQGAIALCLLALKQGENVLLYPAGRLMRQAQETLGGVSAAYRIVTELPDVRVVLVRTSGLWGSSFGWGTGAAPRLKRGFFSHLSGLLASGLFFLPKRNVRIELLEVADLPRQVGRSEFNAYLDGFYNQVASAALYVPYSLWEKGGPCELAPPPATGHNVATADVPAATRRIVLEHLRETTGRTDLAEDQELARDLGLDSLAVTEIILWLEREFAVAVPNVEAVRTVGDILLAAVNQLSAEAHDVEVPAPPAAWWTGRTDERARLAEGTTIQEVFLAQARRNPKRVIVADMRRGARTYRELLTAVFALRRRIAAIEGQYVGILLPASVAADTVFLAVLFAGKTPVMVNWTAGPRNIQHGLKLLGVRKVLTAEAVLSRLAAQGTDLGALQERFVVLEKLANSLTWREKLSAVIRARCAWSYTCTAHPGLGLIGNLVSAFTRRATHCDGPSGPAGRHVGPAIPMNRDSAVTRPCLLQWRSGRSAAKPTDTAVVLFTSGSESLPKAVPLTHTNILTNVRDALSSFTIYESDRFLGMLPPFHSFGLTGTMLLPLLSGAKVVHHPNPNEVSTLAKIIQAYQVTVLLGTPTFVANIIRGAGGSDLTSVRLGVTGAEKCLPEVYAALQKSCPRGTILEGYGITECSPIVAVTRENDPRPGTIGKPLPSVATAIVHPETGRPVAPGQTGMLLVRGPSIFGGYLNYNGPTPFQEFEGQTWYRTGDLVQADSAGRLTFIGRLKRFVKIGGEMVSLPAIEEVLMRAFARPEDKGPCLAVMPTSDENHPELVLFTIRPLDRAKVNEVIRATGLSGLHNIRIVREVVEIPILGTGKTDYQTLKKWL